MREAQQAHGRFTEISDRLCGCLLNDHSLFSSFTDTRVATQSEYSRAQASVQEMRASEQRNLFRQRVQQLNDDQLAAFDKVMETLDTRISESSAKTSSEKPFLLRGRAETVKKYAFEHLQQCAESKARIVLITVTTGIEASLFENGRTLLSLLGLGIDDKDSSDAIASNSSKYGPRSDRAELLCKAALKIFDDASKMDRLLFAMVDVVLNDL